MENGSHIEPAVLARDAAPGELEHVQQPKLHAASLSIQAERPADSPSADQAFVDDMAVSVQPANGLCLELSQISEQDVVEHPNRSFVSQYAFRVARQVEFNLVGVRAHDGFNVGVVFSPKVSLEDGIHRRRGYGLTRCCHTRRLLAGRHAVYPSKLGIFSPAWVHYHRPRWQRLPTSSVASLACATRQRSQRCRTRYSSACGKRCHSPDATGGRPIRIPGCRSRMSATLARPPISRRCGRTSISRQM